MFKLSLFLIFTSLYLGLVRADYTIDDSNYSVLTFSENPAGPVWGPFGSDTGEVLEIRLPNGTMQTVNAVPCYDGTYTYAACSESNNCAVQFSFTGSGITIYVLQAGPQGMSASLSIDSGTPTTATLGAPPPPQYYISRVTLFDVQNIPSGTHTVVMTVLDWDGGFSGMMLDYIYINQTKVSAPTTNASSNTASGPGPNQSPTPTESPSSTPSQTGQTTSQRLQTGSTGAQTNVATNPASATVTGPSVVSVISVLSFQSSGATTLLPSGTASGNSTTPTSSPSPTPKQTNIAAAAGGGVGGGVGLLVLIGLVLFCFRRRRHLRQEQTLNETPHPLLSPQAEAAFTNTDPASINPFGSSFAVSVNQPIGKSRPLQSWSGPDASNVAVRDQSNSSPMTNSSHMRVASSGNASSTSSGPVSIGIAGATTATLQDQDASTPTQLTQPGIRSGSMALPISYPNEKPPPLLRPDQIASPSLTDEQADFVNSLFNNNVPAPVVARVLERMLANPQGVGNIAANDPELRAHLDLGNVPAPAGVVQWLSTLSEVGDGETTTGTAPPSYDYVRAQ